MVYFLISLVGLFGLSCGSIILLGQRAHQNEPVKDTLVWPAIPVATLGLFQRSGRINQPAPCASGPRRVTSFQEAQDVLLSCVKPTLNAGPDIAVRLAPGDEDWTDVLMDGALVVQIPTAQLIAHSARSQRTV